MNVFYEFCKNLVLSLVVVYGAVALGYLSYLGFIFLVLIGGQPLAVLAVAAIIAAAIITLLSVIAASSDDESDNENYWRL